MQQMLENGYLVTKIVLAVTGVGWCIIMVISELCASNSQDSFCLTFPLENVTSLVKMLSIVGCELAIMVLFFCRICKIDARDDVKQVKTLKMDDDDSIAALRAIFEGSTVCKLHVSYVKHEDEPFQLYYNSNARAKRVTNAFVRGFAKTYSTSVILWQAQECMEDSSDAGIRTTDYMACICVNLRGRRDFYVVVPRQGWTAQRVAEELCKIFF